MKHRKKLRRGAILALVLVLLCNAIPARANTTEIYVSSYEELVGAIAQAENMDTIVISSIIVIPKGSALGDSTKQVIIKYGSGAYLECELDASCSVTTTISNIVFDGDGKNSSYPMLLVRGKVDIINCKFQRANAGAVRTAYTQASFTDCIFTDNVGANYGAHINASVQSMIEMDNCSMYYGTAKARGGAVHIDSSDSSITIKNSLIYANESALGGGISCAGALVLDDTVIYNNKATTGGADLFITGTYQIQTIEEMAEVYHEKGLEPLSWESDYEDLDYGGTCLKLAYEAYTAPTPTPDPDDGGDTGEDTGNDDTSGEDPDPTTPSEGEDTGDESTDTEDPNTPPSEDNTDQEEGDTGSTEDTDPPSSSDEETGGNTDNSNTDNSVTDNSTTDNSTTDNSVTDNSTVDNSVTDNSTHTEDNSGSGNATDNSTHSSTTDNSSHTQNTDSSTHSTTDNSSYSEDHSYRDNSSSTVNNYYQQEATGGSQNGSQPINIEVPVIITIPEQKEPATGTTEAPEQVITVPQNIKIEAEGVDLVYEYTESGINISIKATKEPENNTPSVTPLSTPVMATEAVESPQESPNWVEVVTMLLLAVLVLAELKDKWKSKV